MRHPLHRGSSAIAFALALLAPAPAQSLLHTTTSVAGFDDVEITPDQRYAVVRENRNLNPYDIAARVYDLASGQLVAGPIPVSISAGVCLDGVAVTNTRAVVIGNSVAILDLTSLASPLLATHPVGWSARDVAITPDGTLAAVQGGDGPGGGQYLFALATGAQVGYRFAQATPWSPIAPYPWSLDVDDVAVTDSHAVFTGFVDHGSATPGTRVTIWELHPSGGGPPVAAFETAACAGCGDQLGAPHDVAISPNGRWAVVRSELTVGLYDLSVSPPAAAWQKRPAGDPGPFHDEALDSLEVTNERIVTISKVTNPALPSGAQVDVFDYAGRHLHHRIPGSPHDLAIAPARERAVVRTNVGVWLYDLAVLPPGNQIQALSSAAAAGTTTAYFAGLDSLAMTDDFAVSITRPAAFNDTKVWFWGVSGPAIVPLAQRTISGGRPLDVAITPDGRKAVVGTTNGIAVFDLASGATLFEHSPTPVNVWYPWCDGVAVSDAKAVAFGYWDASKGWIDIVDMQPLATEYCVGAPNSAGPGAHADAGGTTSVAGNDLVLLASGGPPLAKGGFFFGTTATQLPFGDGFLCVTGALHGLQTIDLNAAGAGAQAFDHAAFPGVITAGSTWRFQLLYRDRASTGAGFNGSQALAIVFGP